MLTRRRSLLWTLLLAACGSAAHDAGDAAPLADAPAVVDTAPSPIDATLPASTCGDRPLDFSIDEATATARLEGMLADLDTRAPDVYFREAIDGTRNLVQLASLAATLPASSDPRADAITWLADASPTTFTAGEWAPDPDFVVDPSTVGVGDVLFARMVRTSAGATTWPSSYPTRYVAGQGLSLLVAHTASGWTLRDVTFDPAIVLATEADATLLAACAPTTPIEPLATHTFDGLEFDACVEVGAYTYTAQPGDVATISTDIVFTLSAPVDGLAHWNAARPATLQVDAAHYWPRLPYADCMCDDRAGWTVTLDAITGAVQRTAPGILCVVC